MKIVQCSAACTQTALKLCLIACPNNLDLDQAPQLDCRTPVEPPNEDEWFVIELDRADENPKSQKDS